MIKEEEDIINLNYNNNNNNSSSSINNSNNIKSFSNDPYVKTLDSDTPRTPQKTMKSDFTNMSIRSPRTPRFSPRRITSKLPIRSGNNSANPKFLLKDLRLPPDDNLNLSEPNSKVTPEKLMEELRDEVKKQKQNKKQKQQNKRDKNLKCCGTVDDEISLKVPFVNVPRMSMRNRSPIISDAPDLIYEDPLEVARQTLQNTRANSGYRQVKLVYTTERREGRKRASSPEPAFSKKRGITRHFLEDAEVEIDESLGIKFDRVLKLFEVEDEEELEIDSDEIIKLKSNLRPILKKSTKAITGVNSEAQPVKSAKIVHVKRICYEDDLNDLRSNRTKRKLGNNGAAKRLKKEPPTEDLN